MTLEAGRRLGPYEVMAPLGAGGMGEVWRARDTRLSREVAVKVLPAETASDSSRLKRFEKEARSASSLNHPNIVTIYEIGQADSVSYMAMELVEGKTLRELLAAGSLPIRKLLQIGTQMAEGLARAHEAGIVHRDFKPENVMVTKDGLVKILDFGLAKLRDAGPGTGGETNLPTETATTPGFVMGTVGYMSPEQAGGQLIDFRSDHFSFGSVLYEMATGKKAFARGTAIQTLAAILQEEPEPVAAVNPSVPAPLRWVIERCLAKDPAQRYASTQDLAQELKVVRDHLTEISGMSAVAAAQRPRRFRSAGALAVLALAVAAVTFALLRWRTLWTASSPIPRFHQITFRRGVTWYARFAPDGQTIVYAARWDGRPHFELYSSRPESPETRPLGLSPANILSISPLGQMAVLFPREGSAMGTLAEVPLAGGAARERLEDVGEADWSPDGKNLAVFHVLEDKARVEFPIGKVLYETPIRISSLRVSPSGKWLVFKEDAPPDRIAIKLLDVSAGKSAPVDLAKGNDPVWAKSGDELFFLQNDRSAGQSELRAITLSGRQRTVMRMPGEFRLYDISRDNRFLMERVWARGEIFGLAPGAQREHPLSWLDFSRAVDLSDDGRTLLIGEQSHRGVYLRRTDGSDAARLADGVPLSLSPDARWVLAVSSTSPSSLVLVPTGAGSPRMLKSEHQLFGKAGWFPDGKRVWFNAGWPPRTYVEDIDGLRSGPALPEHVLGLCASPDGKHFAALGPDRTAADYPVDGGAPRAFPGVESGDQPIRWSGDGRALFVESAQGISTRVFRIDLATGRREIWREFSPSDPGGVTGPPEVLLSADGKSWVYGYWRDFSDLYLVDGLK